MFGCPEDIKTNIKCIDYLKLVEYFFISQNLYDILGRKGDPLKSYHNETKLRGFNMHVCETNGICIYVYEK